MPRTRLGVRLIIQALQGVPLPPRTLTLCRAVPTARDPRDPSGSRGYVGRWHNPATTLALYTARLRETAIAEALDHLPSGRRHLTIAYLEADIPALLDLTDAAVSTRLPFPLERCLTDSDLSPYRGAIVGDAAIAIGATALLAPCRCGPGGCLCLYAICPNTIRLIDTESVIITP